MLHFLGPAHLPLVYFLSYSVSLCPNPLEALFVGDSHALSKTIRSEAVRRESKEVESERACERD